MWHQFSALAKELIAEGNELFGVPGFYRDEDGRWTMAIYLRGIMIPCRDRFLFAAQTIHQILAHSIPWYASIIGIKVKDPTLKLTDAGRWQFICGEL